jgi:SAM-dependent methyltransferase
MPLMNDPLSANTNEFFTLSSHSLINLLTMQNNVIQRQYDEVIAPHYDLDPQAVIGRSLDRAIGQMRRRRLKAGDRPLKVLDLGMGTGRCFEKLKPQIGLLEPFGIDISPKMIETAQARLPDLVAVVDDVANLEAHFPTESFDLVCTHYITGFVPLGVLSPKIWGKLADGGYWSFIGGTKAGFPALQNAANGRLVKWMFGGRSVSVDDLVCNPADQAEVVRTLEDDGFIVRECETFTPRLDFKDFNEFMDFAFYGGWLTPFLEALGLHKASPVVRAVLNKLLFPMQDYHNIVVALAQKV